MPEAVARLKRRRDYLRVAAARRKAVTPGMVVQACARSNDDNNEIRAGFTASRKVGNAVVRNRARRRLKALADELLPEGGLPATDYVLIARQATAQRDFPALRHDLESALGRLARGRS
ncbi:MAG: ribonuclease P protein component [Rhodospirillales bacterium]|nr:ribonuclease P protein component [Rhodospirillales bacterium]